MKGFISILFITLISCSNFIERQNRIQNINLKAPSKTEFTNLIQELIELFFNFIDQSCLNLVYFFDQSHMENILKDIKQVKDDVQSFLAKYSIQKIVEKEEQIFLQINQLRLNAQTIEAYLTKNKFPEEFTKFIKNLLIKEKEKEKEKDNLHLFIRPMIAGFKYIFTKTVTNETLYNEFFEQSVKDIKSFPDSIDSLQKKIKREVIQMFTDISKSIDDNMAQNIKIIKSVFPKFKSLFMNNKKYYEIKKIFRTFFIIKNIATIEDFDIVIDAYQKILINFFSAYRIELHKLILISYKLYLNEFNIFLHENHKGDYFFRFVINLIEQIFKTYTLKDIINDFKESIQRIKGIVKRIEEKGLGLEKYLPKIKEKMKEMKEENIKKLVKEAMDILKIVITSK